MFNRVALLVVLCAFVGFSSARAGLAAAPANRPDKVLADFEGPDYGEWKKTGEAFGPAPARGTLPDQMPVSGFEGHGLVNSYYHGDGATGTLTSPEFVIERKFVNFLIGGGNHPGETCVNLLIDGKTVRTATGANDEHLVWNTWDVRDLAGKKARIEIVDRHTGGWGHINVDQLVLSDERKAEPIVVAPLYHETYRPQFHFTAEHGWLNDPNGLVYYAGEYHLFLQHNPFGNQWGNMTWGHAVSSDLLHWRQLPNALTPDELGTMFSGSAAVDWNDTAGLASGDEKTLVALYTAAGGTSPESKGKPFTQCLAYSNDRGRSWQKYRDNPVLPHVVGGNRDPKIFWHAGSKQWVMALYLDGDKYALFGSPDLKKWDKLSDLPALGDASECPDLFEAPIERSAGQTKWIFWGANGNYRIGSFDGKTFASESGVLRFEYGANSYAAQTYSDIPAKDGRRIQITWMREGAYPGMPFNQQMGLPSELTVRKTAGGLRLCRIPTREVEALRENHFAWQGKLGDDNPLEKIDADTLDIRCVIEPAEAQSVTLNIRGAELTYDVAKKELKLMGRAAPLALEDGKLKLRILVDRASIEVFAGDGLVTISNCFLPRSDLKPALKLSAPGATVSQLDVWRIKSCWP